MAKSTSSRIATPHKSKTASPLDRSSTKKRKRSDLDDEVEPRKSKSAKSNAKDSASKRPSQDEEKRKLRYRSHAPKSFLEKLDRAQTQRMIVIGRTRAGVGSSLHEDIDVVGSTGNIYKVTIGQVPSCTCPDSSKGNECKHKVYVLHNVLKAPEHLQYQRAFLTTEVEEIFDGAPSLPQDVSDTDEMDKKRKPIEGECPICYMDLDEDNNDLVWCKAACGNNIHKSCFEQWAASQRGKTVKCVYCRSDWQMDNKDLAKIEKAGSVGAEGYVNVADQFGISRARDYTSYHQPWVRRTFGYGG